MTSSITAKNIIMTDVSTGEYLIPYTDKQDKLTAGNNITIENNVISANVSSDTYLRVINGSCSFSVTSLTSVSSQSITLSSTISAVKGWNLSCNDSGYNVNCDLSIGSSVSSISISLIKNNWNKVIDDKTVTVYYSIYY